MNLCSSLLALTNLGMMSVSDIKKGDFTCKKAALLFARGTGEPGNMGYVVGPGLASGLKKGLNGDVLIQGVDYSSKSFMPRAIQIILTMESQFLRRWSQRDGHSC
jgi:hypothetical protein